MLSSQTLQSFSPGHKATFPQLPGVLVQNYVTWREEANSVEEALFNLTTSLDDYRGQYNELQILEETVSSLESFVRVSLRFLFVCLLWGIRKSVLNTCLQKTILVYFSSCTFHSSCFDILIKD